MKTNIKFLTLSVAVAGVFTLLPSCSKENNEGISDTDLAMARDDAYTYALYEEVDNMVMTEVTTLDAGAYSNISLLKSTSEEEPCYTVDVDFPDSTHFPKVVTLDYGDGCTVVFRGDTITRKGKIIITVTDRWFMEGARHMVTFEGFSINGVSLAGTKTITNQGFNDQGNIEIDIKLEAGVVTFPDSSIFTIDAEYQKEWIHAIPPHQDTLIVTGSAAGINVLGEQYDRQITEPLILVHCTEYRWRWVIVDGMVEINNSVTGLTSIDYSANGCDGTVIVNKNGYRHNYPFKYNNRMHQRSKR